MALSRELKSYIEGKYDDKIKKAKSDCLVNKENERLKYVQYRPIIKDKIKTFMIDLQNELPPGISLSSSMLDYCLGKYEGVNTICPKDVSKELEKKRDEEVEKLTKEKELLLIRLSMEKDFDRINKMLTELGIGFGV